jgi:hypothetical protein
MVITSDPTGVARSRRKGVLNDQSLGAEKRTGTSPKQYQLQIRLQKAQDLLVNTSKTVAEIAEPGGGRHYRAAGGPPVHASLLRREKGIAPRD